jgi:hypothetical protein
VLKPPQPESRPAQPQPLLHREVAPSATGGRLGRGVVGLIDPVADGRREQAAEARDVLHRHPEGRDASVALPDAEHDQVSLRVPGDAQRGPALVEEQIATGRQRWRVVHSPSVVVREQGFKAPSARDDAPVTASNRVALVPHSSHQGRSRVVHILGGVVQFGCARG